MRAVTFLCLSTNVQDGRACVDMVVTAVIRPQNITPRLSEWEPMKSSGDTTKLEKRATIEIRFLSRNSPKSREEKTHIFGYKLRMRSCVCVCLGRENCAHWWKPAISPIRKTSFVLERRPSWITFSMLHEHRSEERPQPHQIHLSTHSTHARSSRNFGFRHGSWTKSHSIRVCFSAFFRFFDSIIPINYLFDIAQCRLERTVFGTESSEWRN